MEIKTRRVTTTVVEAIDMVALDWDTRVINTVMWRAHMAKLLNLRVVKLASECNPTDFYCRLLRFSKEIGFGDPTVIAKVTEKVYDVELLFPVAEAS